MLLRRRVWDDINQRADITLCFSYYHVSGRQSLAAHFLQTSSRSFVAGRKKVQTIPELMQFFTIGFLQTCFQPHLAAGGTLMKTNAVILLTYCHLTIRFHPFSCMEANVLVA